MRTVQEDLAQVAQARAYQIGEVLLLIVAGAKPTPCHVVTIERSVTDGEPPEFVARLSTDPLAICIDVITPYQVHAAFQVGSARDEIVVHHADGELRVNVEQTEPQGVARPGAVGPVLHREPVTATGYSKKYDLAEAIHDAIAKIPLQCPGIPDWLSTYTVDSMRIERGGIAGFDHLAIEITG